MVHTRFRLVPFAAAVAGVSMAVVAGAPSQAATSHAATPHAATPHRLTTPADAPHTNDLAAATARAAQVAVNGADKHGTAKAQRLTGPLTGCGTLLTHVDASNVMRTVSVYDTRQTPTAGTYQLPFAPVAMTTIAASAPVGSVFRSVMIGADARGHLTALHLTRTLTGTGTTTATTTPITPSIGGISEMYASGPYLYMRAGSQFVRWTVNSTYTKITGGVQIGNGTWNSLRAIHGVVRTGTGTNTMDVARGINAATGVLADVKLYRRPTSAPVLLRYTQRTGFAPFTKLYSGVCTGSTAVSMYGVQANNALSLYIDGNPTDANAAGVRYVTALATGLVGGRMFT